MPIKKHTGGVKEKILTGLGQVLKLIFDIGFPANPFGYNRFKGILKIRCITTNPPELLHTS